MAAEAGKAPGGYTGIGDDVALIPSGKGKVVLKADMLVEHTDMPRGMTYREAARKAVAMCVSDFAAKGVKPDSFLASIGLRKGTSQKQVDDLAKGFRDAGTKWGVHLVGGDTNEAEELVIDCLLVGFAEKIVTRKGASAGDVLVVSGAFGFPAAGLRIIKGANASGRFRLKALKSLLEPSPNLRAGLALVPYLTASMDSSDGLARSIHTLARESGVGFELSGLPMGEGVRLFASANELDPEQLVLEGGEEYVVVGTLKRSDLRKASEAVKKAGGNLMEIGRAISTGEVVLRKGASAVPVRDAGWTHLG